MKRNQVEIRITGKTGEIDGYVEFALGMFNFGGLLIDHKLSKTTRADGQTEIYIDLVLKAPPLGNLGEADIPEREEKS